MTQVNGIVDLPLWDNDNKDSMRDLVAGPYEFWHDEMDRRRIASMVEYIERRADDCGEGFTLADLGLDKVRDLIIQAVINEVKS